MANAGKDTNGLLLQFYWSIGELNNQIQKERLFTADELQSYTKDELYLAILGTKKSYENLFEKLKISINIGHVFNVSSAPRFYSSTGSYKFYTGIYICIYKLF